MAGRRLRAAMQHTARRDSRPARGPEKRDTHRNHLTEQQRADLERRLREHEARIAAELAEKGK